MDVSTPSARATLLLGMLSYVILLVTLLGGLYLAIDATAGERERGSLESLLTVPAAREQLIYGKVAATPIMMLLALALVTTSIALALRFVPLETFGMTANFGPGVALARVPGDRSRLPSSARRLLTVVASFTRSYKEAQSWLGVVLLVPTVPIAIASVLSVRPAREPDARALAVAAPRDPGPDPRRAAAGRLGAARDGEQPRCSGSRSPGSPGGFIDARRSSADNPGNPAAEESRHDRSELRRHRRRRRP